jgi:DNA recombination protein RmuC
LSHPLVTIGSMSILIVVAVLAVGLALCAAVVVVQRRNTRALAAELRRTTVEQNEEFRRTSAEHSQAALNNAVDTLGALHRQGLESQLAVGSQHIEGKKELIDQELGAVRGEIERVRHLVRELENDRNTQYGELARQLGESCRQTETLAESTQSLREVLSSSKARGQWGERMAEDVLRLAGFVEGIQYRKQTAVQGGTGIPDFTFLLPQELALHMDVKFPLDNYLRYCEAESELDRERHRKDFLRDVRGRVRELSRRDYVDVGNDTVDCMLLFIPNEQVYAFIQEHDRDVLDDALRNKVVFCSPLTLFAVLAVIRQAIDNFQLERTSQQILGALVGIEKQWHKFVDQMEKVGRNLKTVTNAFDELEGTRRRQLDRQFDQLETMRRHQLMPIDDGDDHGETFALEA